MNTKYRFTFIKDTIKNTNMYRLLITLIISLFVSVSSMAGSDGENELSKNSNGEVKDCFETINRGVFAFNQVLDNVIVEPLANAVWYFLLDKFWASKVSGKIGG